jgi:hypothetical protein
MPIHLEFFPPDRILVGVARGDVSLEEYQAFLVEVVQKNLLHYRKIIDITSASTSTMNIDTFIAFEKRLSAFADKRARGPLAIVVEPGKLERAQAFKAMTSQDRPVEAFTSLREARLWLMKQPVADLR